MAKNSSPGRVSFRPTIKLETQFDINLRVSSSGGKSSVANGGSATKNKDESSRKPAAAIKSLAVDRITVSSWMIFVGAIITHSLIR
jgi:hypothetical protein